MLLPGHTWAAPSGRLRTISPRLHLGGSRKTMSRQGARVEGQPAPCSPTTQAARSVPSQERLCTRPLRLHGRTWECFPSMAMTSSCARMSLIVHHPPKGDSPGHPGEQHPAFDDPRAWETPPRQASSLQIFSNAIAKAGSPTWLSQSLGMGQTFCKCCQGSAKACVGELTCRFLQAYQQGSTCELSQAQNEGKGHGDTQIRSNQEPPTLPSLRACETSLPPLPDSKHPSTCPVAACTQGLGRASPSRGKMTSHGLSATTKPVIQDSDDTNLPTHQPGLRIEDSDWPSLLHSW